MRPRHVPTQCSAGPVYSCKPVSHFLSRASALFARNGNPQPLPHQSLAHSFRFNGRGRVTSSKNLLNYYSRHAPFCPASAGVPCGDSSSSTSHHSRITSHGLLLTAHRSCPPLRALLEGKRSAFLFQGSFLLLEWPRFYIRVPGAGSCPTHP